MSENPLKFFWDNWRGRQPLRRHRDLEERTRRLWGQTLCLLTLALGLAYLVWVGRLIFANPGLQDALFLGAEILTFLLLALLGYDAWFLRYHPPEGLEPLADRPVDVLVPCCGEPLKVIATTLRAIARIPYRPLEVYILDDAGSGEVAALAGALGFHYHSRPLAGRPCLDSKSGNLNFGLRRSSGEFILVLDADQVPQPEIVSRLLGFFRLPRVAYVQSKQEFFLPEGDPFYNADKIFYETLQLGNDRVNAVISCGSGVMYRRAALDEVKGFLTWNIVEDFSTSYELVSRGWKGLYFPHALREIGRKLGGLRFLKALGEYIGEYHPRFSPTRDLSSSLLTVLYRLKTPRVLCPLAAMIRK